MSPLTSFVAFILLLIFIVLFRRSPIPSLISTTSSTPLSTPQSPPMSPPPLLNSSRKNVMLILSDDLRWAPIFPARPQGPLEGGAYKHAPNLVRLGESSVTFDRAFANVPWCGPSRACFLTGREPTVTKAYSVEGKFRTNPAAMAWRTLPQFMLDHGYKTYAAGKVFHRGSHDDANPDDWTQILAANIPQGKGYTLGNCIPKVVHERPNVTWMHFSYNGALIPEEIGRMFMCRTRDPIELLDDFVVAHAVVAKLKEIAVSTNPHPFFMAVGFYRPHLPYHLRREFWGLHELDLKLVPEPKYIHGPEPRSDMPPDFAVTPDHIEAGVEMHAIPPVYVGLVDWKLRKAMRVGYAAAISQMDAALGLVLDALDQTGLVDSTAVIFYGDHGFQLGESSLWYKKMLTDYATHVPMMIRVPWLETKAGAHAKSVFVELIDVYRTIADVLGVEQDLGEGVVGKSLRRFLAEPEHRPLDRNNHAISVVPRCRSRQCRGGSVEVLGFSVRTEKWRYNVWVSADPNTLAPLWEQVHGDELYSHANATEIDDHFNLQRDIQWADVKLEMLGRIKERYG